ncbi:hypothetical protein OGM63_12220 [Plectonema radiosum NIES-515]|uniref:Uncharacterized protein n=1 Tax=Plectonema radiosum NIES-515 TaxID=2986073 RepID=A0ABT3AYR3_9CYAN|nr:hypothetical protein [Plectonema radiosum]MCV3214268.1 hypothetical protein [Plectonema radiosum NIES-515]
MSRIVGKSTSVLPIKAQHFSPTCKLRGFSKGATCGKSKSLLFHGGVTANNPSDCAIAQSV